MTPFDDDWHVLSLARGVLELLGDPAARRQRDADWRRLERLAAEAAERVDRAVHAPTPGRYRVALRRTEVCAAWLRRLDLDAAGTAPLPVEARRRAGHALRLQLALLEALAAGRRATPARH